MRDKKVFEIAADGEGARADMYLTRVLEGFSRSRVQSLIREGAATVNGNSIKPSELLHDGDVITVVVPELTAAVARPEDLPLDVLYEDHDIIVVNKPAGMVTHPAPGSWDGTLVNALLHRCTDLSGVNGSLRPGIVHRLDKDTSGVIVAAKNDTAHLGLARQIEHHEVEKEYVALVHGHFPEHEGTISTNLARSRRDYRKMVVAAAGKPAVTHFRTLEELGPYSLMEVIIETGRTHQIRVHMQYRGHPVVGDPLYGPTKGLLAGSGQLLHARRLQFMHPSTGQKMVFEAPIPLHFASTLEDLGSRQLESLQRTTPAQIVASASTSEDG